MINRFLCKLLRVPTRATAINRQRSKVAKMGENDDDRLETFRNVCDEIGEERSYNNKAKILAEFFRKGTDGQGFKGDIQLWVHCLIPGATNRVYNLQNKQLLKLFARLLACDQQEMQRDLEQEGDVSETLRKFFESSKMLKPQKESILYLQEVDAYLQKLEQKTKEEEQSDVLRQLCKKSTPLDLRTIVRLIKQDLRINAGARHILDAFGPLAYSTYQSTRNLEAVVKKFSLKNSKSGDVVAPQSIVKISGKIGCVQVMTPISPMLANACKSVEEAFKKSPTGLYTEIKYDGERVQIHKRGGEFKFFSRNLKPVMEHKIKEFHQIIPKAFPFAEDMILDSEIIMVDAVTGDLLPFGSLGVHKKKEYMNAQICIFTFDCIFFNGEDLTNAPFRKRRGILEDHINPIKHRIQLSESQFLTTKNELSLVTAKVLKANLEGVVLKNPDSTYQPGKRGWLKVKKDYLFGGKMADTADLVVLGASFGSGKKGGLLSVFLMGCRDPNDGLWKTVTKVHTGLDDATHKEVHDMLMTRMQRTDPKNIPSWFLCRNDLLPDYVAKSPKEMPVWEITGAEFTKSDDHTAAGISIRFPRITRLRVDKDAEHANDLKYLRQLYTASKKDVNVDLLLSNCDTDDIGENVVRLDGKLNTTPMKTDKTEDEKPSVSGQKTKRSLENVEESKSAKKPKLEEKGGSPRKPVHKQLKLDFGSQQVKAKVKESKIFKDCVAYFDDEIGETNEIVSSFTANGGTVTKDPRQANMALYKSTNEDISLDTCREKFQKSCRHLSVNWVEESLKTKTCQPYGLYAIVLK